MRNVFGITAVEEKERKQEGQRARRSWEAGSANLSHAVSLNGSFRVVLGWSKMNEHYRPCIRQSLNGGRPGRGLTLGKMLL